MQYCMFGQTYVLYKIKNVLSSRYSNDWRIIPRILLLLSMLLFTWSLLFRLDVIITPKSLTFDTSLSAYSSKTYSSWCCLFLTCKTSLYLVIITILHSNYNNCPSLSLEYYGFLFHLCFCTIKCHLQTAWSLNLNSQVNCL